MTDIFGEGAYSPRYSSDRQLIRELIEFERYCRDYALWDEMRKLYTEDSRIKISWYNGSGSGFVDASMKMPGARHKLHNVLVQVNGDKALAAAVVQIQSRNELSGSIFDLLAYARLFYRLVRVGGAWKIYTVDCVYERDEILPLIPGEAPNLNYEKLRSYRRSYCYLCCVLEQMGAVIDSDLPGEDRPESIDRLSEELGNWLERP